MSGGIYVIVGELLVAREMGVPGEEGAGGRWAVDHLFLDDEGVPTLDEVKRSGDARVRREVVGQNLDYAADAMLHWPVATIRARFEARCESEGLESGEALAQGLGAEGDPD